MTDVLEAIANSATLTTVIAASIIATTSGDPDRRAEGRAYLVGFLADALESAGESFEMLEQHIAALREADDELAAAELEAMLPIEASMREAIGAANHLAGPELAQMRAAVASLSD